MIQLYQKITQLTILELFIKNPYERYYLREASRMLDISPMTDDIQAFRMERAGKKEQSFLHGCYNRGHSSIRNKTGG